MPVIIREAGLTVAAERGGSPDVTVAAEREGSPPVPLPRSLFSGWRYMIRNAGIVWFYRFVVCVLESDGIRCKARSVVREAAKMLPIPAPAHNVSGLDRFSYRIVIKPEIIGPVSGLGIFKHDTVTVISMAGNHCHAIIIICIHL